MALHPELASVAPHAIHGTNELARAWLVEAHDLEKRGMAGWSAFVARWMAFNALYNLLNPSNEIDRVKLSVEVFLDPAECADILREVAQQLALLNNNPPGNDRYDSSDIRYREQSTANLKVACNPSGDVLDRLRALLAVVYLIRCNLVHGNKHPERSRDRELVQCCSEVLEALLPRLRIW